MVVTLKKPARRKSKKLLYQDTTEGKKETAGTKSVTYQCVCSIQLVERQKLLNSHG
jgi:hypothetical protein